MPSVSGSKCLKDAQTPRTDEGNLLYADKKCPVDGVVEIFPAAHKSSALRGDDCIDDEDKSHQTREENGAKEEKAEAQIKWIRPDLPSRCTWSRARRCQSPLTANHTH
uniref:PPUP9484 n=1 Tax=Poeciliopsis prolifica TaxID=188132 RepID=A0A0S7EQF9_9TELE